MAQPINNIRIDKTKKFKGNIFYSSVNQMISSNLSFRDDLESVAYILGEMLDNKLPWN